MLVGHSPVYPNPFSNPYGDINEKHMGDLLHIPVTRTDTPRHDALRDTAEVLGPHTARRRGGVHLLDKDDPARSYYRDLHRKLLQTFRDAKRVAAKTKDGGGADHAACAKFEGRAADLVAAYGSHKFATALAGAAPNIFTFPGHPGMPPANNDTERYVRDAVVVQRKIRRPLVNARGVHVFSAVQSFNSTCRKLGLVAWRCVEKMVDDQKYDK